MTIADLLADSGLSTTDAEVLLAHAYGKDRTWIHAHATEDVPAEMRKTFSAFARRRMSNEPIAYILGTKEFYGRDFFVGPGVLIPRPCTEELVRDALRYLDGTRADSTRTIDNGVVSCVRKLRDAAAIRSVVDLGTGSGCIAITIACERPDVRCMALDVSNDALSYARKNAEACGVDDRVSIVESNFLEKLNVAEPFLLVSNPPYVADPTLLDDDVRTHEPSTALLGGASDGGNVIRVLMKRARSHPLCTGIVLECLESQASDL